MRQAAPITEYDPKQGLSIATLAYEYVSRFQVPEHAHGSDQLIYAVRGVMEVSSGRNVWFIPPQFALWIPALTYHRIHMPEAVSMRTLYLCTSLAARLETDCAVLHVRPLLRELILEVVKVGELHVDDDYHCGLRDVLIRQLHAASTMPTMMTLPREERALALARVILRHPAESRSMRILCSEAGVGVRTMERMFLKEVGTSFEAWRRQVRLTKAVELLVSGCSVKEAACRVGYSQSSTLVELFRQTFGTTPRAWISSLKPLDKLPTR